MFCSMYQLYSLRVNEHVLEQRAGGRKRENVNAAHVEQRKKQNSNSLRGSDIGLGHGR